MSSRSWVLAGVVSGAITGLAVLALVAFYGPQPTISVVTPTPPGPTAAATAATPAAAGSPAGRGPSSPVSPSVAATPAFMRIGQPAPALVVPQVGGGTIDLASLRGRPVWVAFLTTGCEACIPELTRMNELLGRHSSTGLVVLGVDVGDDEGVVATFALRAGATFPFGLDADGSARSRWEAGTLPAHYWISREAIVVHASTGVLGAAGMAGGLAMIIPEAGASP